MLHSNIVEMPQCLLLNPYFSNVTVMCLLSISDSYSDSPQPKHYLPCLMNLESCNNYYLSMLISLRWMCILTITDSIMND